MTDKRKDTDYKKKVWQIHKRLMKAVMSDDIEKYKVIRSKLDDLWNKEDGNAVVTVIERGLIS